MKTLFRKMRGTPAWILLVGISAWLSAAPASNATPVDRPPALLSVFPSHPHRNELVAVAVDRMDFTLPSFNVLRVPVASASSGTSYWTCTMHPEIHQADPGRCPKCGMYLVQVSPTPAASFVEVPAQGLWSVSDREILCLLFRLPSTAVTGSVLFKLVQTGELSQEAPLTVDEGPTDTEPPDFHALSATSSLMPELAGFDRQEVKVGGDLLAQVTGFDARHPARNTFYFEATQAAPGSTIRYWTCEMHPQVQRPGPGSCPICGMALIPAQETGTQVPAPALGWWMVKYLDAQGVEKKALYLRLQVPPGVKTGRAWYGFSGQQSTPVKVTIGPNSGPTHYPIVKAEEAGLSVSGSNGHAGKKTTRVESPKRMVGASCARVPASSPVSNGGVLAALALLLLGRRHRHLLRANSQKGVSP